MQMKERAVARSLNQPRRPLKRRQALRSLNLIKRRYTLCYLGRRLLFIIIVIYLAGSMKSGRKYIIKNNKSQTYMSFTPFSWILRRNSFFFNPPFGTQSHAALNAAARHIYFRIFRQFCQAFFQENVVIIDFFKKNSKNA